MRTTLATKQAAKDSVKQNQYGDCTRSTLTPVEIRSNISPLSTGIPLIQRQCACGGGCPRCQDNLTLQTKLKISEPGDVYEQEADSPTETLRERVADRVMQMPESTVQRQLNLEKSQAQDTDGDEMLTETQTPVGLDAGTREAGAMDAGTSPSDAGVPTPTTTPCPTSVSIGQVSQFNHSNLSSADQAQFRTYLGAISRMDVGPGSDHSGHCMKEYLSTVSNTCPAEVYKRGETTTGPCTGNKCLDINRGSSLGDPRTHTTLTDGATSFLDLHRTINKSSLLEGTGLSSCDVVCEQIYKCDRTGATTGKFHITRQYQAGTLAVGDSGTIHITTGTVTKVSQP